jgi:hypothetical protein
MPVDNYLKVYSRSARNPLHEFFFFNSREPGDVRRALEAAVDYQDRHSGRGSANPTLSVWRSEPLVEALFGAAVPEIGYAPSFEVH